MIPVETAGTTPGVNPSMMPVRRPAQAAEPSPAPQLAPEGPAVPSDTQAAPGPAALRSPGTGDARVDAALGALETLDGRPVAEHVPAFEQVHRALQDTLAAVDGS